MNTLNIQEEQLYWAIFTVILIISNIIFLNFIIAEASESYNSVKVRLEALTQLERAKMINECEFMAP